MYGSIVCHIVTVAMHVGLVHVPDGKLADYERPLTRAAIDAGADVVVGHHAHALRGVEVYKADRSITVSAISSR